MIEMPLVVSGLWTREARAAAGWSIGSIASVA